LADKKLRIIVGVAGRAESGKDTICDFARSILTNKNFVAKKIACADPLKDICEDVFWKSHGVPPQAFYGAQADKNADLAAHGLSGWSGRKILQYIGTEGFRYIDSTIWAKHVAYRANQLYEGVYDAVFVSDVRFPEEAEAIKSIGGVIWRVYRPSSDQPTSQGLSGHQSETSVDKIIHDRVIHNGGTLDDLRARVDDLLSTL